MYLANGHAGGRFRLVIWSYCDRAVAAGKLGERGNRRRNWVRLTAADPLLERLLSYRVFSDSAGKMNRLRAWRLSWSKTGR
jgi:hypothetical protein